MTRPAAGGFNGHEAFADQITCEYDSGSALGCVPACSDTARVDVTMRMGTGSTYTTSLCSRHALLHAWNDGYPGAHVTTTPIANRAGHGSGAA